MPCNLDELNRTLIGSDWVGKGSGEWRNGEELRRKVKNQLRVE